MGCKVTTMAFSELYTALQQGVIEAEENPLNFMMTNSFYEVQKYVALTNHSITLPFLFISEATWETLTVISRTFFLSAPTNPVCMRSSCAPDMEDEVNAFLAEKGTVIHEVDIDEFKNAVESIYPTLSDTVQYWIEKIQSVER